MTTIKKEPVWVTGHQVETSLARIEEGLNLIPECKEATIARDCLGWDFFASVEKILVGIRYRSLQSGRISERQIEAIENMVVALERWKVFIETVLLSTEESLESIPPHIPNPYAEWQQMLG